MTRNEANSAAEYIRSFEEHHSVLAGPGLVQRATVPKLAQPTIKELRLRLQDIERRLAGVELDKIAAALKAVEDSEPAAGDEARRPAAPDKNDRRIGL